MYFIGLITTVLIIPWISDKYGRKWPTVGSYVVFIIAAFGILLSSDIIALYVF